MVQALPRARRIGRGLPSASSSDLLGNGEMLVMRTIERPADPLGELVGPQKPVELHDPPFPVYPLGLYQPDTIHPSARIALSSDSKDCWDFSLSWRGSEDTVLRKK